MQNLKIYPYNMGSESAKDLSTVLDCTRVRADGTFVPKMGVAVINWGNSATPNWMPVAQRRATRILNLPAAVGVAANKLLTLNALRQAHIPTPDFTTDFGAASAWHRAGLTVVERHTLTGSSGAGIRVADGTNALTRAPLFTKYIYKEKEFRVHVFRGQVIDYIQKKKRTGAEQMPEFDRYVYSVERGWVFVRGTAEHIQTVKDTAIASVRALGLDFGAVDIVTLEGRPFVLEVNTAPGVTGTTLLRYVNAFREYMGAAALTAENLRRMGFDLTEEAPPVQPTATRPATTIAATTVFTQPPPPPRPVQTAPRQETVVAPRPAAPFPTVEMVTVRMDRETARKLKALFAEF